MNDRVYPSKPANGTSTAANPTFPATKSQLNGANRLPYRPQPQRRRRHHTRSCCCSCCLWISLIVIILLLLAAAASTVVYFLYRPHRPSFSVNSLKVSYINVTSSSMINSKLNISITARNPNKKLVYIYDPTAISIFTDDVYIGGGSVPAFVHGTKNTTVLKSSITGSDEKLDSKSAASLKSDLKSNNGLPLKVELETKVKVKLGSLKSPKVRIRVSCDGIKYTAPKGKTPATASTANAKCKVDLRFKIWKWTF